MRQLSLGLLTVASFLVGGCAATSPVTEANLGNDQALINLVMTDQVNGNTALPFYETTKTVFCALLPSKSAAGDAAIDKLLQQGVDINKKCLSDFNLELPLDVVIHFIGHSIEPGLARGPQDAALFQARAEKLLALGAKSAHGSTQMSQVLEEAERYSEALLAVTEQREEMQRQAKRDSLFNLENMAAIVQVAGGAVNNYAAAKEARSPYQPLQANTGSQPQVQKRVIAAPSVQNSSTMVSSVQYANHSAPPAKGGGRLQSDGTMYTVVYAELAHTKRKTEYLVERIVPIKWTTDTPRTHPLQTEYHNANFVDFNVEKQARAQIFDAYKSYLKKYPDCKEAHIASQGCYGRTQYFLSGKTVAEVEDKLRQNMGSRPFARSTEFNYPITTVSYRK